MAETKTLNLVGQICPDPLVLVQEAMRGAGPGDVFEVTVDYPLAVENVARWAEAEGWGVNVEKSGSEWRIRIAKA